MRADGDVRPRNTFLSALTGQEFATLLTAGWVPTGLTMGLAVMARHDKDYLTERQRRSRRNQELVGRTELIQAARREARVRLREDCARFGGAGVVVRTMTIRTETVPCRNRARGPDRLVEALIIGTAITPFGRAGGCAPPAPLPVVRLSNPLRGKEHEW